MIELELEMVLKLLLSVILGSAIGFERERRHKPAGLRTHTMVSLGSCLITITSMNYFLMDPARVASGIIAGIGFLGAGSIIAEGGNVKGLTTAASLWVVAAIGLSIGAGAYLISIIATVFILIILEFGKKEY